jgi:molybdate transport system ATP-binding protein
MSTQQSIHARFNLDRADFSLDVDLDLPNRGVTALFGHSGSGKTTLLRCIAGLERAQGELIMNGEVWQDANTFLPTHKRQLGYVFQEASLFPHLTARGNLDYGRSVPNTAPAAAWIAPRWITSVDLLGIGPLLDRRPDQLSGRRTPARRPSPAHWR